MGLLADKFKNAWNAFLNRDPTQEYKDQQVDYGANVYVNRPDRIRLSRGNDKSIITPIYNRIALDVAALNVKHVRLDEQSRYSETIKSGLNDCLTLAANQDQTARCFIQDIVMSMLDEGCVAIVPTDTTEDPRKTDSYDILAMRVGKIELWYPDRVKVKIFNERLGKYESIILPKRCIGIIENPLYAVMNERNSILKRLVHKLDLLDIVDEQTSAGKLDLIIQLPYVIKTEQKRQQAEARRKDIEHQLKDSKYGIAYTDGTEHITQLNRSLENNLLKQVEYLTNMAYAQLGTTPSVMDGSADEQTMLNYTNRTVEPIISAIVDEMKRKFLTKTARSQGQSIMYFRDPFRLVPVNSIAEIADKFTRNEIMTSNEIRQAIGMLPSKDPAADELRNKNLSESSEEIAAKQGLLPNGTEPNSSLENSVEAGRKFVEGN